MKSSRNQTEKGKYHDLSPYNFKQRFVHFSGKIGTLALRFTMSPEVTRQERISRHVEAILFFKSLNSSSLADDLAPSGDLLCDFEDI